MAHILVIEDNPTNLQLMTYLLGAFGHETLTAPDGEPGVELARREWPDLIVCDVQLPRMDGWAVARQLKSHPALSDIPLLAVTAYAMVGDRDKLLAAGFDGYIAKPIDPETFVQQVEAFLRSGQRSTPHVVAPTVETPARPPGAKHAILLAVDDRDVELSLMHSVFDPSGYEMMTAHSLSQALELARQKPPDLILSDVNMPGGSGFDLLEAVQADPQLRHIPVILITSTAMSERDRQRALAGGAVRYIMRPIEPLALLAEVEACLQEQKQSSAAPPAKRATILVVDNVSMNLELIRSTFEPSGYEVLLAGSAQEGLSLARQAAPDLILSDLHMPEASGLDFLQAVKADPQLSTIPFVINTASLWTMDERKAALALGARQFLLRPMEPQVMLREIEACLQEMESL